MSIFKGTTLISPSLSRGSGKKRVMAITLSTTRKTNEKRLWLYVMLHFGFLDGREMEKENLFRVKVDIENDKLIHIVQSVFVLSPWKNLCI